MGQSQSLYKVFQCSEILRKFMDIKFGKMSYEIRFRHVKIIYFNFCNLMLYVLH